MKITASLLVSFFYFYKSTFINFQFLKFDIDKFFPGINFSIFWISLFLSLLVVLIELFCYFLFNPKKQYQNFIFHVFLHLISIGIVSLAFRIIMQSRKELTFLILILTILSVSFEKIENYKNYKKISIVLFFISIVVISSFLKQELETNNVIFDDCKFIENNSNQNSSKKILKKFLIVGHAYGNPKGSNFALQETLLKYFENNNLENTSLILTGDIIRNYSLDNLLLAKNQIELYFDEYFIAPGNHDLVGGNEFYNLFGNDFFSIEIGESVLIGANFNTPNWLPSLHDQYLINETIQNSSKRNVFLFSHQVFWFEKFPNSDILGPYALLKVSEKEPLSWIDVENQNLILIAGDLGVFGLEPFCKYDSKNNTTFISNAIGNYANDNILELVFFEDNSYQIKFKNLNK